MTALVWLLLALAPSRAAWAHADLLAMIESVSKRIATEPHNANLYFLRGELYRAHADWKPAEADYTRAAELDPRMAEVDLARGKLLFESGRTPEAKAKLDEYLAGHPNNVDALITRAQLLARAGRRKAAAADYTRALDLSKTPRPDYFLERAQLLAAEGETTAALHGLDEGINRLGNLVALQLCAIDLECAEKRFDAALARLDSISSASERQEKWLVRRGEILHQYGREAEAAAAFRAALAAIDSLPPRLRTAPATLELQKHAQQELAREN